MPSSSMLFPQTARFLLSHCWITFHLYLYQVFFIPYISWWTLRLFLYLSFCEYFCNEQGSADIILIYCYFLWIYVCPEVLLLVQNEECILFVCVLRWLELAKSQGAGHKSYLRRGDGELEVREKSSKESRVTFNTRHEQGVQTVSKSQLGIDFWIKEPTETQHENMTQ